MNESNRVTHDDQLIDAVWRAGRDSAEFRYLCGSLHEMGMGALRRMGPREALAAARSLGVSVGPAPVGVFREFTILCSRAVDVAVLDFVEVQVLAGMWRSGLEASIRSVFLRSVLVAFAGEYQCFYERHVSELTDRPPLFASDGDLAHLAEDAFARGAGVACRGEPDHGGAVAAREWLRRLLPDENHPMYRGVVVPAQKYVQREFGKDTAWAGRIQRSAVRRACSWLYRQLRRVLRRSRATGPPISGAEILEPAGRGVFPAGSRVLRALGVRWTGRRVGWTWSWRARRGPI